jgi:diguanylate cyclase (GGDEF)-like protein
MIVVLLDLDHFKTVNDTHGHDAGDDLLIEVADRIDNVTALYGGKAARLSGDEYAAFLPARDREPATVAHTFLTAIAKPATLPVDDTHITVAPTASVGLARVETSDQFEVVLHRADTAMYHAKNNGGNGYAIHQPGMIIPTSRPRRGPRPRDLRHRNGEATA